MATIDTVVVKYATPLAGEVLGGTGIICSGDTGIIYYVDGLENSLYVWNV